MIRPTIQTLWDTDLRVPMSEFKYLSPAMKNHIRQFAGRIEQAAGTQDWVETSRDDLKPGDDVLIRWPDDSQFCARAAKLVAGSWYTPHGQLFPATGDAIIYRKPRKWQMPNKPGTFIRVKGIKGIELDHPMDGVINQEGRYVLPGMPDGRRVWNRDFILDVEVI